MALAKKSHDTSFSSRLRARSNRLKRIRAPKKNEESDGLQMNTSPLRPLARPGPKRKPRRSRRKSYMSSDEDDDTDFELSDTESESNSDASEKDSASNKDNDNDDDDDDDDGDFITDTSVLEDVFMPPEPSKKRARLSNEPRKRKANRDVPQLTVAKRRKLRPRNDTVSSSSSWTVVPIEKSRDLTVSPARQDALDVIDPLYLDPPRSALPSTARRDMMPVVLGKASHGHGLKATSPHRERRWGTHLADKLFQSHDDLDLSQHVVLPTRPIASSPSSQTTQDAPLDTSSFPVSKSRARSDSLDSHFSSSSIVQDLGEFSVPTMVTHDHDTKLCANDNIVHEHTISMTAVSTGHQDSSGLWRLFSRSETRSDDIPQRGLLGRMSHFLFGR